MFLGIGTDIIEIGRIRKAIEKESFRARVYTPGEMKYCKSRGAQAASSFAVRFAAKEAVMKALGTGLRGGRLTEIEVIVDALGAPHLELYGSFRQIAEERGVRNAVLSLSHAKEYATAVCLMEG